MKFHNISTKLLAGAFTAVSALVAVGCTDLDEHMYSDIPGDGSYEFSDEEIQSMYGKIYDRIRDMYDGWEAYHNVCDETSDVLLTPFRYQTNAFGAQYASLAKQEYYPTMDHLWRPWYSCYQGITTCNQLLDNETISKDPAVAAELRTYRALFYYVLFDMYRNIPLETTLNVPAGYMPEQSKPEDTWNWIVNELNEAKPYLTKKVEFGQINYYGACTLLAKMYLNRCWWLGQPNSQGMEYFQKAIDECNEVLHSGAYELAQSYREPFGADTYSKEVIFAIMFDNTYAGNGTNYFSQWYPAGTSAIYNITREGWNGSCAIPQFMNSYDADDTRKTDSWKFGPQVDYKGEPLEIDGVQVDFTIDVTSIDHPGAKTYEGARMSKYEFLPGDINCSNDDVPFFRLADVMFIKAECLLRTGGYKGETKQDAADLITQVRQRAFQATNPAKATRTVAQLEGPSCYDYGLRETQGDVDENGDLTNITVYETHEGGSDIILGGLLDDLAWEFTYEHHRRQDLCRFELTSGNSVHSGKSWFGKKAIGTRAHDIFPIHDDFLKANPKLVQNTYK